MSDADPPKPVTKRPRPKYQVFVSSTYDDLHDERREATWEILKAGHIPAGMENFTATDERGWQIIRRTIDRSDYYVVLVAGRYGSVDATTGLSWTEREYKYARERAIPVLAFVREDGHVTKDKTEPDPELQRKLEAFKSSLRSAHLCDRWGSVDDLRAKLAQSVRQHIQDDEDNGTARPGWYRGDEVPSVLALDEFARLSSENVELHRRLAALTSAGREILEVVNAEDGSQVTDQTLEVPEGDVVDDDAFAGIQSVLTPTHEQAQRYASKLSKVIWFELSVLNKGNVAAQKLVVDFEMVGASDVFPHEVVEDWGVVRSKPFYLEPGAHVLVESWSVKKGVARLRQRVEQIAPGSHEALVAVGFSPNSSIQDADGVIPMKFKYEVRSQSGALVAGAASLKVMIRGVKQFTRDEILGVNEED